MDRALQQLKEKAEALWDAPRFSHVEAARLVAEIIQLGASTALTDAARQALPSLQQASAPKADELRKTIARQRFGSLRSALYQMAQPVFGRRPVLSADGTEFGASADIAQRRLLGLPARGPIYGAEIAAAYRRRVKEVHPDQGGSADAFRQLVAARDALLGKG